MRIRWREFIISHHSGIWNLTLSFSICLCIVVCKERFPSMQEQNRRQRQDTSRELGVREYQDSSIGSLIQNTFLHLERILVFSNYVDGRRELYLNWAWKYYSFSLILLVSYSKGVSFSHWGNAHRFHRADSYITFDGYYLPMPHCNFLLFFPRNSMCAEMLCRL